MARRHAHGWTASRVRRRAARRPGAAHLMSQSRVMRWATPSALGSAGTIVLAAAGPEVGADRTPPCRRGCRADRIGSHVVQRDVAAEDARRRVLSRVGIDPGGRSRRCGTKQARSGSRRRRWRRTSYWDAAHSSATASDDERALVEPRGRVQRHELLHVRLGFLGASRRCEAGETVGVAPAEENDNNDDPAARASRFGVRHLAKSVKSEGRPVGSSRASVLAATTVASRHSSTRALVRPSSIPIHRLGPLRSARVDVPLHIPSQVGR